MLTTRIQKSIQPLIRNFSTGASVRDKELEFYSQLDDWWKPNGP